MCELLPCWPLTKSAISAWDMLRRALRASWRRSSSGPQSNTAFLNLLAIKSFPHEASVFANDRSRANPIVEGPRLGRRRQSSVQHKSPAVSHARIACSNRSSKSFDPYLFAISCRAMMKGGWLILSTSVSAMSSGSYTRLRKSLKS